MARRVWPRHCCANGGGAVAVWASSSLTEAAPQGVMNDELFRLVFNGSQATLGDAVTAAKQAVADIDVRRSWVFFGDPAMRLKDVPVSTDPPPVVPPNPKPFENDYDGDGKADLVVFRPPSGTWFTLQSSTAFTAGTATDFGVKGDLLVPGDYDGDGRSDLAVFRPATATWYIRHSSTATDVSYAFGKGTDIPVPGDYDGDLKTDPAVYRPSTGVWHVLTSSSGYATTLTITLGASTDMPVPADYDGDGNDRRGGLSPGHGHLDHPDRDQRVHRRFHVPVGRARRRAGARRLRRRRQGRRGGVPARQRLVVHPPVYDWQHDVRVVPVWPDRRHDGAQRLRWRRQNGPRGLAAVQWDVVHLRCRRPTTARRRRISGG